MPTIILQITNEGLKAMESIVPNVQEWAQGALDGRVHTSTMEVLKINSNINPDTASEQEKSNWIRDNSIPTRAQRDAAANP